MNELTFLVFFILIFAILPCAIAGYFISFKQQRGLIAGWNDKRYSNPVRGAQIIGIGLLLMSFLLTVLSCLFWLGKLSGSLFIYSLVITTLLPVVCLIYVEMKYKKTNR